MVLQACAGRSKHAVGARVYAGLMYSVSRVLIVSYKMEGYKAIKLQGQR
jgi:hypothetical protein